MRLLLQKIIINFLYYSGLDALGGYFLRDNIFVINYHSIGRPEHKEKFSGELYENLSVEARHFDEQIAFLKKHKHTFFTFSDLPQILKSRPRKPTLIYFDDGFKDNVIHAMPILKKYEVPATVFISTGLIDRTHFLWTLKHRYFLRKNNVASNKIEKEIIRLKGLSESEREELLAAVYSEARFVFDPANFNVFLNWEDVRLLAKNGWEIGSHGATHSKLTECPPEVARSEIFDSRRMIKVKIGRNAESFSFPYGRFNDRALELLQSDGYRSIVSSGAGVNDFSALHKPFCFLRTIGVRPSDRLPDFLFKLYTKNLIKQFI